MNLVVRNPGAPAVSWWQDPKMLSLVKRTAAKDCGPDEFDEFVSVCRDLNLSPLRKQIYCFIFSKGDAEKRNMTLVVGIDGGRAIAARSGNYRPDDQEPQWVFRDELKNPLTNPHGIEKCTVGVMHRPTKNDPFQRIVHTVFWEEYAPIVRGGDEGDYDWVDTGETWPDSGKPKKKKVLRQGATAQMRLDPKKEQWIRSGRNMIAKCAEMGALRKGWPEDLSRVVVDEETHRAQVLDGVEYSDLTPSQMAEKGETDARMEKIGGPALFATFDAHGTLERVPYGQFVDRMLDATAKLPPAEVIALVDRNREALKEFWAHNKNDALELKKILEQRSGATAGVATGDGAARAKAASPDQGEIDAGEAAERTAEIPAVLKGQEAFKLKTELLAELRKLVKITDFLSWSTSARPRIDLLPTEMQLEIATEFQHCQSHIGGAN